MLDRFKLRAPILLAAFTLSAILPSAIHSSPTPQEPEAQGSESGGPMIHDHHDPFKSSFPDLGEKQKKLRMQANLDKSRKDSEELASLAHEFQNELGKQTEGPLSPDMALELERIEKLARKIRDELGG